MNLGIRVATNLFLLTHVAISRVSRLMANVTHVKKNSHFLTSHFLANFSSVADKLKNSI